MTNTTNTKTRKNNTRKTATRKRNYQPAPQTVSDFQRAQWWTDHGLPSAITARLTAAHTHDVDSIARIVETADRYRTESLTDPLDQVIERHLLEADTYEEQCDRWAVLRTLELMSYMPYTPRIRPGWAPSQLYVRRRPLSALELGAVRISTLTTISVQEVGIDARCATVAAMEGGAIAGELAKIMPRDAVRGHDGVVERLELRGTLRSTKCGFPAAAPREVEVPMWARAQFTALLDASVKNQPDGKWPLLVRKENRIETPDQVQSSLLMRVRERLDAAGFKGDKTVIPGSLRNTTALKVYEEHGIVAAKELLGYKRFDFVMEEIGLAPRRR